MDFHLEHLDVGQWAWEFLRRNPDYQTDYREFIAIWQALEADYGAPPHRDFPRWKTDPRAVRPAWDTSKSTGAACVTEEEDTQLIECWMGSKWGFYQFPQDPSLAAWQLEAPIHWRPSPPYQLDHIAKELTDTQMYHAQLNFDLSLPLPAQLEAAKLWLISRQAALRKQGIDAPRTLANQCKRWGALIQALDSGEGDSLREALQMSHSGYREILRLIPIAEGN